MSVKESNVKGGLSKGVRVYYVEPNDVYGSVNGQPLTPDYTDMCISFNLRAEVVNRANVCHGVYNKDNNRFLTGNEVLETSWVTKRDETEKWNNYLSGESEKYNYLTTYYTRLNPNTYEYETQSVEGLGVESCSISYENYFTPTIKIKFVDVRGNALFGREEANHSGMAINKENIFGAFFTMPYPKFTLQVKGFYGDAVSYQLCCSDFRGSFNSQTGNFEADVTFIGYDFGVISDVNMMYLEAAPYCDYVGRKYWDEHVNSPEWQLYKDDGTTQPPIRLFEFVQNLKNAIKSPYKKSSETEVVGDADAASEAVADQERATMLNEIAELFSGSMTSLKNVFNRNYTLGTGKNHQFCTGNTTKVNNGKYAWQLIYVTDRDDRKYFYNVNSEEEKLNALITEYNAKFPEYKLPNTVGGMAGKKMNRAYTSAPYSNEYGENNKNVFTESFDALSQKSYDKTMENFQILAKDLYELKSGRDGWETNTGKEIKDVYGNTTVRYDDSVIESVIKWVKDEKWSDFGWRTVQTSSERKNLYYDAGPFSNATTTVYGSKTAANIPIYAAMWSDRGLYCELVKQADELGAKLAGLDDGGENGTENQVMETDINVLTGITPYIGNVFKMILCHLETFAHMLYKCDEVISGQIANNERTDKKLGITDCATDVSQGWKPDERHERQIPSWPNILRKVPSAQQDEGMDNFVTESAWVGQFNGSTVFEEYDFITKLFDAWRMVSGDDGADTPTTANFADFPTIPSDLLYDGISNVAIGNIDSLSGYLALRAAVLFGVMNNGEAKYNSNEPELLGRMDAYNLYSNINSKEILKVRYVEPTSVNGETFEKAAENIALCQAGCENFKQLHENKDSRLSFEVTTNLKCTSPKNNGNQPFFEASGGKYKYTYSCNEGGVGLVPVKVNLYRDLNGMKIGGNEVTMNPNDNSKSGGYYYNALLSGDSERSNSADFVHKVSASGLYSSQTSVTFPYTGYKNPSMFKAYADGYGPMVSVSEKMDAIYRNLSEHTIQLTDYSEETTDNNKSEYKDGVLKKYWAYGNEYYDGYYFKDQDFMTRKLEDIGVKTSNLLPANPKDTIPENVRTDDWYATKYKEYYVKRKNGGWHTKIKQSDGTFAEEEISSGDCVYQCLGYKLGNDKNWRNLFGSDFYYMQNVNGDDGAKERSEKSKCLLFLHTLRFNYDKRPAFLDGTRNCGVFDGVPYGYLVFLGGLVWRKRYMEKNGHDPIRYGAVYKPGNSYNPLIYKNSDGCYIFKLGTVNSNVGTQLGYGDIFGSNTDVYVENELEDLFNSFVTDTWLSSLRDLLELKDKQGNLMDGTNFKKFFASVQETEGLSLMLNRVSNYFDKKCFEKYRIIKPTYKQSVNYLELMLSEGNPAQGAINTLYNGKTVVAKTSGYGPAETDGTVTIDPSLYRRYLAGFGQTIAKIAGAGQDSAEQKAEVVEKGERERDIYLAMYISIKSLWERWFISYSEEDYLVKNMFKEFIFTDSFYRNKYTMKVNGDKLADVLASRDRETKLFSVFDHIAKNSECLFMGLPSFGLYTDSNDGLESVKSLENLFKPIPYIKMSGMRAKNKIVVMHTNHPSEHVTGTNGYEKDDFDIWSGDEEQSPVTLPVFNNTGKSLFATDGEIDAMRKATMYGYMVPSFGVAYSKQSNSIFKNININMSNPVVTDQTITAMENIIQRSKGDNRAIAFYGQDIYSVYSGYSYTCDIEMMGNAQIMPLMYFQLTNIPMFRGAYMIYKVTHEMRPGDMTTRITAMKMSRHANPEPRYWFTDKLRPVGDQGKCGGNSEDIDGTTNGQLLNVEVASDSLKKACQEMKGIPYNINNPQDKNGRYIGISCDKTVIEVYKKAYGITGLKMGCTNMYNQFKTDYVVKDCVLTRNDAKELSKIAEPGDVLFEKHGGESKLGHVMIYLGNGNVFHASSSRGTWDCGLSNAMDANDRILHVGHINNKTEII